MALVKETIQEIWLYLNCCDKFYVTKNEFLTENYYLTYSVPTCICQFIDNSFLIGTIKILHFHNSSYLKYYLKLEKKFKDKLTKGQSINSNTKP